MARTVAQIEADLEFYRAAYRDFLAGKRVQGMKHGDREISFGSNFGETKKALREEISLLERELARAQGRRGPNRPVGV